MKIIKKLLSFTFVFVLIWGVVPPAAMAAGYYWDFEDIEITGLPTGFSTAELDTGVYYSTVTQYFSGNAAAGVSTVDRLAVENKSIIMSSFFTDNRIQANRWLITPALEITGEATVWRWLSRSQDPDYLESYNVLLSTTGDQPGDFTVTLESIVDEPIIYQPRSVDLSGYIGQTVYIAYQLVSQDEYLFHLDNMGLMASAAFDPLAFDDIPDRSVFQGDSVTLQIDGLSGGESPFAYAWSDGDEMEETTPGITFTADTTATYTCTVTDIMGNSVSDSALVSVQPSITAAPASLDFGSATEGYAAPAAQTVTVENVRDQSVTLTPPASVNYDIGALSASVLAVGETATFTVQPKGALPAGVYDETITVSTVTNASAHIDVHFTVGTPDPPKPAKPADAPSALADSATGVTVSGAVRSGMVLIVSDMALGDDEASDMIRQYMAGGEYSLLFYKDISLSRRFSGAIDITIPVDERYNGQTVTILHYVHGALEAYTATVRDGKVTFTVTSLSPIAGVTVQTSDAGNGELDDIPETGGSHSSMIWWLLCGLSAIGIIVLVALWKRKRAGIC